MGKFCKKIYRRQVGNCIFFLNKESRLHNLNGPAKIYFWDNACIKIQEIQYLIDGKFHRNEEEGPAIATYHLNGVLRYECYIDNDVLYRTCGPVRIHYNNKGKIDCVGY